MKKIFIVPYCHPDWAWTFTRNWHIKRYLVVFEEVIDIIKKNPEFRWYMDTYITQFEPVLKKRKDLLKELKKFVKEGKIEICGGYTNLRPSMTGEETQIRDLIIGREKFKKIFPYSKLYVYAGTVDVSVGHPQIPQILKKAGYKYLRFWRPHFALSKENVPIEFYWVGIDGTEILVSRGCYSGFNYYENLEENLMKEVEYYAKDSITKIIWISMGMDDSRPLKTPYTDIDIPAFEFIKDFKKKIPIKFATPSEYFKEIEKEKLPKLKISLDPCEVSYNVGWGGNYGIFSYRQKNEINLTEAEKISSIASIYNSKYPDEIKKLWEKHLLTCAHATSWLFEDDFDEIYKICEYIKLKTEEIKKEKLEFLCEKFFDENGDILIFNTLPFERNEYVNLWVSSPYGFKDEIKIYDGKGNIVDYQIIDKNEKAGKVWEYFICAKVNLPSFGFNTFYIKEGKRKEKRYKENTEINFDGADVVKIKYKDIEFKTEKENPFFDIKFYKVDTKKGILHVGPIEEIKRVIWRKNEIIEDGILYKRYLSEGEIEDIEIKRNIYVFKNDGFFDFEIEVEWKGKDGFLTFEIPYILKNIYGGIPFGVEEKDIEKRYYLENFEELNWEKIERQRKNLFYARKFINLTDGKNSISYINYDATHYYILFEKSVGNILLNSFKRGSDWERFINKSIEAEGKHKFFSRIFIHKGDWRNFHLPQKSQSAIIKPYVVYSSRIFQKKNNKNYFSFLSLEPETLILTSFYKEGDYYIVRFYESEGIKTEAKITLPFKAKKIEKIDFIGNKISEINFKDEIKIEVKPWEIVTLRVKR